MFAFFILLNLILGCNNIDEVKNTEEPCSWMDADGDGFGDPDNFQLECTEEAGWVSNDSDCDDADANINPNALEQCDGVDQDCDGAVDDHRVPSDYATLQLAVDDIPDGSTLCVEPGTYAEKVNVTGRVLNIQSQQGKEVTFLDLAEGSPIFLADDRGIQTETPSESTSEISISGFTLTGTHPDLGQEEYLYGGLIYSTDGSITLEDINMQDVSISLGQGGYIFGALAYTWGGTLNVNNINVSNVSLGGDGQDMYAIISGGIIFTENTFGTISNASFSNIDVEITSNNEAAGCHISGGVIIFPKGNEDHVSQNLSFQNNTINIDCPATTSSSVDGAIALLKHHTYVDDVRITHNSLGLQGWASSTRGFLRGAGINLNISNLEASHNFHRAQGRNINSHGIVYFYVSEVYGHNWKIYDNEVDATKSPLDDFSNMAIGGGLKITDTSGVLSNIDVRGNRLASSENTTGAGISISLGQDVPLQISRFVSAGNELVGLNYVTGSGIAISTSAGDIVLQNGDIYANKTGNTAQDVFGTGISITGSLGSTGQVTVQNVNIVGNTAQVQSSEDINRAVTINDDIQVLWAHNNVYGNVASTETRFGENTQIASGNISADPEYVNVSAASPLDWDFELTPLSPCIDAGVPEILDSDGSISDIGSHGGSE